jgi:flagellar hook-associated protein 3 FlgL
VNDVHSKLIKSFNKISSGAAYETAADNPLAYYTGKKIDDQYLDTVSKNTLLTDVKNRLYQQELGARDIQDVLSKAKKQVQYARTATTTGEHDIQTIKEDLIQKVRTIANDLNTQYQDFYIYGGNDVKTTPFDLNVGLSYADPNDPTDTTKPNVTLTYRHTFPGETNVTEFQIQFAYDDTGENFEATLLTGKDADGNDLGDMNDLIRAMSEQGRIDIGYGSISNRDTLLDTYTGGLNILTGLNSDAVRSLNEGDQANGTTNASDRIMEALSQSPIALVSKAIISINDYNSESSPSNGDKDLLDGRLAATIDEMTVTEHTISTAYSDLGNKYLLLEETGKKLDSVEDSLMEQYKDVLGADPYASVMEMFTNQYAYNAALQVGSKLMTSSLFDFVR